MNFCIYPAGAWGTAMAIHLDRLGHGVTLVPFTLEESLEVASSRENSYLPGFTLRHTLQVGMELKPALMEADCCVISCPSRYLRDVCRRIRSEAGEGARNLRSVVLLTKGLEPDSNEVATQVASEELPGLAVTLLSGPTFASQVAAGKPSAIVLAGDCAAETLRELQAAMSGPTLRIYTTGDVRGVAIGGSLKNVYAIASGCCDGLGLGDNAKAALLTRSLAEMVRVGVALGGQAETFFGLSGFGDLVLTCNGQESRNRTFGERIGRGESIDSILADGRMTVEGYKTCRSFHRICQERGVDAPILAQIHETLFNGQPPVEAIGALMGRSLKAEKVLGREKSEG